MSDAWTRESDKHERPQFDVRDLKFKDNSTFNIRIMPPFKDDGLPFCGYTIHWIPQANAKLGKPIIHGIKEKCCVCHYIHDLWEEINKLKEEEGLTENHPRVKAVYDKISPVKGAQKYDFNVLDRNDLIHTVNGKKVLAAKRMTGPSKVWKPIFEFAKNPKWGSPSDEVKGYDLQIVTEGEGQLRQYSVTADRESSPLTAEEKEAMKTIYDLQKLRPTTSLKDIREYLENAKPPYEEILNYFDDSAEENTAPAKEPEKQKSEPVKEAKKSEPVKEAVKEAKKSEPVKEEPVKQAEPVKEESKAEPEPAVVEEVTQETPATTDDDGEDVNDIDNYECKGEFEDSEVTCRECPVKDDCVPFVPIFNKAKELKINIDPSRSIEQITNDVKAATATDSKPSLGKKKKNLPF